MVPVPKAVRMYTSDGWQDLALQGPAGPAGAGGAMQLIEDKVLTSAQTVVFANIPQDFKHLCLVGYFKPTYGSPTGFAIRYNNDASAAYYWQGLVSTAATAPVSEQASGTTSGRVAASAINTEYSSVEVTIPEYSLALANFHHGLARSFVYNGAAFDSRLLSHRWNGAGAINRIEVFTEATPNTFAIGSRATLYGLGGAGSALQPPPLVSTLPSNPVDGAEVYFLADATNGIIWHLRYRAASASAYKWEFLGGPKLYAEWAGAQGAHYLPPAYGSFVSIPASKTQITPLPLAGDYMAQYGYALQADPVGLSCFGGLFDQAGASLVDYFRAWTSHDATFAKQTPYTEKKLTGRPAGSTVELKVQANRSGANNQNAYFYHAALSLQPIRVD
jgi:hypothetical protein